MGFVVGVDMYAQSLQKQKKKRRKRDSTYRNRIVIAGVGEVLESRRLQ